MAVNTVSSVGAGKSLELVLGADGRVSGSSGCGKVSGTWASDGDRAVFADLEVLVDGCEGPTRATAGLLDRVLSAVPTATTFEGQPDTLQPFAGGVCTQVLLGSGSSASCGETDKLKASLLHVVGGQVVHGSAPEGTAEIRLEHPDGAQIIRAARLRGYPGRSYFAATVPAGMTATRAVALDAEGRELARTDDVSSGASIGAG